MKKYYTGLLVIGLVTLGLAAYVLNLGAQSKQDKQTYEKANELAEKLNNYTSETGNAPVTLEDAGAENVPDTISYQRVSSSEYKFCATYKTDRGYGTGDITGALTGAALSNMYDSELSSEQASYSPSYLYVGYTYKKGENCQTVKIRSFGSSRFNSEESESSDTGESLESIYCSEQYRDTFAEYCAELGTDNSAPSADEL